MNNKDFKNIEISKIFSIEIEKEFVNKIIRRCRHFDDDLYFPNLTEEDISNILLDMMLIINELITEKDSYRFYAQIWFYNEIDFIKRNHINLLDYFKESLLQFRGFFSLIYFILRNDYTFYLDIDDLSNCTIKLNRSEFIYINNNNFLK